MRFGRNYRFTFGQGSTAKVIEPPISCVFSAQKTMKSEANQLDISLYNLLDPPYRSELDRDYIPAELAVGYGDGLDVIFRGNVIISKTLREGADFVTKMVVLDGGKALLQGFVSQTVKNKSEAVKALLAGLPEVTKGVVAETPELSRPRVLVGSTAQLFGSVLGPGQEFFIDNEQVFVLGQYDVREGYAPVVSADTGLIGTPEADKNELTFVTMLNPAIKLGGLVKLETVFTHYLDGIYKVKAITISGDTDGDDWSQQCTCIKAPNYEVPRG